MELLDVTDKNGKLLGITKGREQVHRDGDWHKVVHIWLVSDGKLLLQRRAATKDIFPNLLDFSCNGHVRSGESCEAAAAREMREELGIRITKKDITPLGEKKISYKSKGVRINEIACIFLTAKKKAAEPRMQDGEVWGTGFYPIADVKSFLKEKPERFIPFQRYMLETIAGIEKILKAKR
ncbi:MAG: NUDIX domain-containing protein [Candidatus Aenigmatarchaeota archaeon]